MPHFPEAPIASSSMPMHELAHELAEAEQDALRAARIRTKNRRKRYLDLHPEYFRDPSLELADTGLETVPTKLFPADPLLYDRLVRRFQSAEERERDGRLRGFGGVLEANFVRSEAKIEAIQHPDPNSPLVYVRGTDGSITGVEQDEDDRAQSKEEGWEKWKDVISQRFLRGDDRQFEYDGIDDNEEYDDRDEEERSILEEYLGDEEETFLGEGRPQGETGVQDF